MALIPDSTVTVQPYLIFSSTTPAVGYIPNQHENDNFVRKNALNADKFNEYERLFYNLCTYLGDITTDMEDRTVGSMIRYINTRVDDLASVSGEGRPASSFHLWALGGRIFDDPYKLDGNNTTEPRVNQFEPTFNNVNFELNIARGTGIVGNSKNSSQFVELDNAYTIKIDAAEYSLMGNNVDPYILDVSSWTNGEEHTISSTTVTLNHNYVKRNYFFPSTAYECSVVIVLNPTTYYTDNPANPSGNFDLNVESGVLTNVPGALIGQTVKIYYPYYQYRVDHVILQNSTNDYSKLLIKHGSSCDSLTECFTTNLYTNYTYITTGGDPDYEKYKWVEATAGTPATFTLAESTMIRLYSIIVFPWNTTIEAGAYSYLRSATLDYTRNLIDYRTIVADPDKQTVIESGVLPNSKRIECIDNDSDDPYYPDWQSARTTLNSTFNSYFGATENVVALSASDGTTNIDSQNKWLESNTQYILEFFAYATSGTPTLTVNIKENSGSTILNTKTFTIDTTIRKYRWTVFSHHSTNLNNAHINLVANVTGSDAIYVDRPSMSSQYRGFYIDAITQYSNKYITILSELCNINGKIVLSETTGLQIAEQNTFGAIICDITGTISVKYGSATMYPLLDDPSTECYKHLFYVGTTTNGLQYGNNFHVLKYPAKIDTDFQDISVTDSGEFMASCGIPSIKPRNIIKTFGGMSLYDLSDISLMNNTSLQTTGPEDSNEIYINGTFNITEKCNIIMSPNTYFSNATAGSTVYIGDTSSDQSGIFARLNIGLGRGTVATSPITINHIVNSTVHADIVDHDVDYDDISISNEARNTIIINAKQHIRGIDISHDRSSGGTSRFIRTTHNGSGDGGSVIIGNNDPYGDVDVVMSGNVSFMGDISDFKHEELEDILETDPNGIDPIRNKHVADFDLLTLRKKAIAYAVAL